MNRPQVVMGILITIILNPQSQQMHISKTKCTEKSCEKSGGTDT